MIGGRFFRSAVFSVLSMYMPVVLCLFGCNSPRAAPDTPKRRNRAVEEGERPNEGPGSRASWREDEGGRAKHWARQGKAVTHEGHGLRVFVPPHWAVSTHERSDEITVSLPAGKKGSSRISCTVGQDEAAPRNLQALRAYAMKDARQGDRRIEVSVDALSVGAQKGWRARYRSRRGRTRRGTSVIVDWILRSSSPVAFVVCTDELGMGFGQHRKTVDEILETKRFLQTLADALMGRETLGPLKLGMTGQEVVRKLGTPSGKGKPQRWGADGRVHQSWSYRARGIELDFVLASKKYTLSSITAKDPCSFKTSRGIGIGSSAAAVKRAYFRELNLESSKEDSLVVAGTLYGGALFGLNEGKVSSIFIGASHE